MDPQVSFDNLPQAVKLLHQKLEVVVSKLDNIASQNSKQTEHTFIGVDEAAALLGISKASIYSKVYHNVIPYYKSGGKLYFSKQELLQEILSRRYPKQEEETPPPKQRKFETKATGS